MSTQSDQGLITIIIITANTLKQGVKWSMDNIYTFLFKSINRQVHQFKKSGAC